MCGIVYFKSFDHSMVNKQVLAQYKKQRSRGFDGFGFYLPQSNRMTHHPAERRIKGLLKRSPGEEILFHHRFPTSTKNTRNACHPFSTKDYFGNTQYIMVHNGYLSNSFSLRADHQKLGIDYVSTQPDGSFNDSEALMWDLALTFQGKQAKPKAEGMAAFIMIERRGDEAVALHFGRNSNPLHMKLTESGLSLSSEGVGELISLDTHYTYDYATGLVSQGPLTIDDGYTYRNYSTGYTTGKSYDWQGISNPYPKVDDVAETVYAHGVATGDTISTASDLLMESNLDYTEAKDYATKLIKQYSRRLAASEALGDAMTERDEINANLEEQIDFGRRLQHWTEVLVTIEDWDTLDNSLKEAKHVQQPA